MNPEDAPVGQGMAKISIDRIAARKQYNLEAVKYAEQGQEIPSFEEWLKGNPRFGQQKLADVIQQ